MPVGVRQICTAFARKTWPKKNGVSGFSYMVRRYPVKAVKTGNWCLTVCQEVQTLSTDIFVPQHQGTLCRGWGGLLEKPFTSLKRPSPTAATYDFIFNFSNLIPPLVCQKPEIPLNFCWELWFPPNYSDYSYGQLLVFGGCVFPRFLFFLTNTVIRAKRWILRVVWLNF